MEGQTATNPQTGEKIVFRGGQWQPVGGAPAPRQGPISSGVKQEAQPSVLDYRRDARDEAEFVIKQQEAAGKQAEEAEKAAKAARSQDSAKYNLAKVIKQIAAIRADAADNGGWFETGGTGSFSRNYLPSGTAAFDLAENLKTVDATSAFSALQQMRDNSPTGGALGAITENELDLLKSTISNLNPDQSQEQFQANAKLAQDAYIDMLARIDPLEAYQVALDNKATVEEIMDIARRNGGPIPDEKFLKQAVDYVAAGKAANPKTFQPPETPPEGGGPSIGESLYAGVGDIAQGVGEGLGIIGNPLNAGINAIAGTNLSTDLGRTFREATGAPQGNALASAVNRGGTAALTGAGLANLTARGATGMTGYVANALAQQPVQQVVGGVTAGASAEGARQAGAPAPVQAAAGIMGGMLGYGGMNALMRPTGTAGQSASLIPNARQVVQDGKSAGVRVMTSDIRPPTSRTGKLARNIGDSIPIAGTAGPRAAQQVERGEAVQKLMREFGADDAAVEAVSKDLVKTRGAMIGKLSAAKNQVIQSIQGAVPAPKAIAEIDKQIAKLQGIDDTAFKPVIDRLTGFKTALQSGKTLEQVEGQRRLLGDLFSDPSLASIKGDGQKAINAVYDPLRQDMGAFIEASAGPAARAKWAGANERLAAMAGELDASAFKNLLNNAETTPESAAKILFGKTPSDMKRLYGSLSDKGRAKAQSAILFQAAEKSTTNDVISPQKFAAAMEAMSKATGVFFSPADKARIDGVTRLIKATQHASDAAANPMTGAQNTPLIAGLSIGQIFGTAALPVTAFAGLTARVYESAPVRDAFLRLGRTKPNSPQEANAIKSVIASIAAAK